MIPLVSVIVVSYNTRELTLKGLTALRAACVDVPYEVILVDNASADGSAEAVAQSGLGVRVLRLAHNVGFGRAVNAGAEHARGRWLLLLNPDTEPVGDVIADLVRGAQDHPGRGIYTGRTLRADGTDDGRSVFGRPSLWGTFCFASGLASLFRGSRLVNPEELPALDRTQVAEVAAVSGCLLLIERSLFAELGGFSPVYFMYCEDIDLCTRAARLGAKPTLVPAARLLHVNGASSTTANKIVMLWRGKCTYVRQQWSPSRAALGRAMLATAVLARAAGSRLTGRAGYWREVWRRRAEWLDGWPPVEEMPAVVVDG